ncbi:MAG: hypothetical protein NTX64_01725, partial [Elusimicrobia bacterium]|nr:hypothetical protein [Elusimicrobiota bacterium]
MWPCGATDQVIFTVVSRNGQVQRMGPFAVWVDTLTLTSVAVSTPGLPANTAFVNVQPNFSWMGPSTATVAGLPAGSSYYLQISNNDPTFGSVVANISTPAISLPSIVVSTFLPNTGAAYISTFTLLAGTTYYWRVAQTNGIFGVFGAWSSTSSFVLDVAPPAMSGLFSSVSSTGGLMGEVQVSNVIAGATAQVTITDVGSGLAVSTMALVFGGDGHEGPEPTEAFGVLYSTNAGKSWIAFSTVTTLNGGNPLPSAGTINALTMFNGKLYAATAGGYVYSYDGNIWALTNYNLPVGNGGG